MLTVPPDPVVPAAAGCPRPPVDVPPLPPAAVEVPPDPLTPPVPVVLPGVPPPAHPPTASPARTRRVCADEHRNMVRQGPPREKLLARPAPQRSDGRRAGYNGRHMWIAVASPRTSLLVVVALWAGCASSAGGGGSGGARGASAGAGGATNAAGGAATGGSARGGASGSSGAAGAATGGSGTGGAQGGSAAGGRAGMIGSAGGAGGVSANHCGPRPGLVFCDSFEADAPGLAAGAVDDHSIGRRAGHRRRN